MASIFAAPGAGRGKGLRRSLAALFEALRSGAAAFMQPSVYYPSDTFVDGTIPAFLTLCPFVGEVTAVAVVVTRAITSGPSDVVFDIGGTTISTLAVDGAAGSIFTEVFDPPLQIDLNELLSAQSDGVATGNSAVTVFATVRGRTTAAVVAT